MAPNSANKYLLVDKISEKNLLHESGFRSWNLMLFHQSLNMRGIKLVIGKILLQDVKTSKTVLKYRRCCTENVVKI